MSKFLTCQSICDLRIGMKKYTEKTKPDECPKCGSKNVVEVPWGDSDFEYAKLTTELEEGRIELGGSVADEDNDPVWQCNECKTEIYKG